MASIAPPPHNRSVHTTDDWITPRWLLEAIGPFDLDPCASETQPWQTAKTMFKASERDGLFAEWNGLVFCNPPYGAAAAAWLNRMAMHNNGIALVFARAETRMFFASVWPHAETLLFLKGRLTFCRPDGSLSKAGHNSGGPSVLIAYGEEAMRRLEENRHLGALVRVV